MESAYEDMGRYLDGNPYLPTAYFADNDLIAMSCIRALKDHGLRVPEDISVIGFDDVSTAAIADPPLTTMAVPKTNMGGLAVRRLVEHVKGETGGEVVRISVLPEIVQRESVMKAEEDGPAGDCPARIGHEGRGRRLDECRLLLAQSINLCK